MWHAHELDDMLKKQKKQTNKQKKLNKTKKEIKKMFEKDYFIFISFALIFLFL